MVAFEARVEELVRIREACPVVKGKLHLPFVGVGDRDYSVARPHRASHPFPFLDDLPVGLEDALADAGERLATPVREFCDQPTDTFRWIHWISIPRILFPFHFPTPNLVITPPPPTPYTRPTPPYSPLHSSHPT